MSTVTVPPAHSRHRHSRGRLHRALHVVTNVVLGVAVLVMIALAVSVVALKIGFAPVLSPSMQPAFAPGELLLTREVPATDIKVGDVVVLPSPDTPGERYAHRVISMRTDKDQLVVRTKGDANQAAEPVELRITSEVVPKVTGSIPWVGEAVLAARLPPVRIAVIVLIGVALLVATKRALWRTAR
jgi:signal peptidase